MVASPPLAHEPPLEPDDGLCEDERDLHTQPRDPHGVPNLSQMDAIHSECYGMSPRHAADQLCTGMDQEPEVNLPFEIRHGV